MVGAKSILAVVVYMASIERCQYRRFDCSWGKSEGQLPKDNVRGLFVVCWPTVDHLSADRKT